MCVGRDYRCVRPAAKPAELSCDAFNNGRLNASVTVDVR
jgi:hypothetical protein